jgi:hypothetical protein
MAEMHWRKYLPKKYKALQEAGTLEQELMKASLQTEDMLVDLGAEGGMRLNEAKEIVLPQFILLPPETDQEA